ncbi:unnamed protein product [Oppiella nova]|uniref:BTB domain-containing protein n=1 Tax=Oppiella nova TaxID=334625 RepID=A0A7R9QRL4_9ACAR|nr:unnamed protein product [Oppiella nova]CAG2172412.1 unnamed protein product [Oppiella nova]
MSTCEWRADWCLSAMYAMRPHLCDVSLATDDNHHISAHRVVLASTLQYFNAMFIGSTVGGQYVESGLYEIHIKNIDGPALNEIIKWCYTGCVDTSADNVQQLMSAAKMLDCGHVVAICSQFIESQLHPENALGVYGFAELLDCRDLQERVGLIPEDSEDMWHIYNLIQEGDSLRASTFRKVTIESGTGSTQTNKVRTMLTICIESIEYDTQGCVLRVKGKNIEENQYVKMGQYHTLDIEQNRKFTLTKAHWDSVAIERLDMACDPTQSADLGAVVMNEGIAHVCLVTSSMTLVRAKIDMNIPRKRKGFISQHEKGLQKFFDAVLQAILRHMNFEIVKCVLLASPGFVKDQFYDYMNGQAVKNDIKVLVENKTKFVLCHASSGFKHSLKEVLSDPLLQSRLADTKAASEVKALQSFYTTLQTEPCKAFYGIKHVERANECQAIDLLLISDKLFRCANVAERKRFVALVDSVRENGGEVKLFSSLHVSGEQLDQLTGVAAILRFPMQDLDDEPDDSSGEDD